MEVMLGSVVRLDAASPRQAACMAPAQQLDQFSAQGAARLGIDGAIDGLVRDVIWAVHDLESAGDLLRGTALAKGRPDQAPEAAATRGAQLAAPAAGLLSAGGIGSLTEESDVAIEAIDTSALELT